MPRYINTPIEINPGVQPGSAVTLKNVWNKTTLDVLIANKEICSDPHWKRQAEERGTDLFICMGYGGVYTMRSDTWYVIDGKVKS